MIQTPKDAKLVPLFASAIKEVCSSPDGTLKCTRRDTPLNVRLIVGKDGFEVTDEHNTVSCEFSKGAIYWYKVEKHTEKIKDLGGRLIILNEYAPSSVCAGKDVDLVLHVFSFTLASEEESKGHKSPSKGLKDLAKDAEIASQLDVLKNVHLRNAISKMQDLSKVPNLEDILSGNKTAQCNTVITDLEDEDKKKKKGKEEDNENTMVSFKEIDGVEKSIVGDLEILSKVDAETKDAILAGSEGDINRRKILSKRLPELKEPAFVEFLSKKGLLDRARTPSKASPPKRGKMTDDLKNAVAALMTNKVKTGSKEEKLVKGAEKRKKAEGKKKTPAAEKKVAVEEGGKKAAKTKTKEKATKHGKTSKKK